MFVSHSVSQMGVVALYQCSECRQYWTEFFFNTDIEGFDDTTEPVL